jgi:hypothetical protein
VESVEGLDAVSRNPEIAPMDVAVRPAGQAGVAQNQSEVGGADPVARTPPAHSGASWESDQPGVVQPGNAGHAGVADPTRIA